MFKAKLIESSSYYDSRRIKSIFYFLPALPAAVLINFFGSPIWLTILAVLAYIILITLRLKNQMKISSITRERVLELDDRIIRVISKGTLPSLEIQLTNIDKINISKSYGIPEESLRDMANEIYGDARKNFIEISGHNNKLRFDFIIESYYMLKQFDKIIESWIKQGVTIERI